MNLMADDRGQSRRELEDYSQSLELRVEDRTRELGALLAVAQTIGSTLDLGEILRRVSREMARLLDADTAGACMADPDGTALHPVAGYHVPKAFLDGLRAFPIPLTGHRFLEDAWESKGPVFSSDAAADPRVDRETLRRFPHRSVLFVPVVVQAVPIGGLFAFWWEREGRVTSAELHLVEGIVSQAATAVTNARLYEGLARKNAHLQVLFETARRATESHNLSDILPQLATSAAELIGADASSIRLLDPAGTLLEAVAHHGLSEASANRGPLKVGEGAPGQAVRDGQPVVVEDLERDHRILYREQALAEGLRSMAVVPLRSRDRIIGALSIYTRAPRRFRTSEIDLLSEFGNLAAIAIENARLFSTSQAQTAALAEKNAELDSFVYVVSHDLKAPLITIEGMASILRADYANALDSDANHLLERIQANARHMEQLIGDLLALSRIGREARAPEAVNLTELVGRLLVEWDGPIRARGVQVAYGNLPTLQAIPTQMEQAIGNLLSNALKYLGDTPSPRVEIGAIEGERVVECYVKDNGIGIDPAYHERVFEIFHRLKEVEAEGTGVGLAIVKKIVEGAGGRVWVDSLKGEGATFLFTWPKAARECSDGSQ